MKRCKHPAKDVTIKERRPDGHGYEIIDVLCKCGQGWYGHSLEKRMQIPKWVQAIIDKP